MKSAELVRLLAPTATVHVGHIYNGRAGQTTFTLCGLHDDLEVVYDDQELEVGCKRCRNSTAEDLRQQLETVAQMEAEIWRRNDRIDFLRVVLGIEAT